jgi:hypothetical protein
MSGVERRRLMLRYEWLLMSLFVILLPLPGFAQTATELRQKYKVSSRIESYDVRPGIIATVSYGEDGKVATILLTPPMAYNENGIPKNEMPVKVVEEVLNELVPMSRRGEVCEDYGFFGSAVALNRRIDYENVSISSITRGDVAARQVLIEWTKCAGKLRP